MNLDKLKESARKFEQKEDWRRAIEIYHRAIQDLGAGAESVDPGLYNRVGDLEMKAGDAGAALRAYEQAADLYADQGFYNNSIALCGKILRVNPGRTDTYLKLAQLHARKNVIAEAKRNLLEYVDRMHELGRLEEAFRAVEIFADMFSGNPDIRLMLSELLRAASRNADAKRQLEKLAADLEAHGDATGARRTRRRMESIERGPADARDAQSKGSELIFLDTGFGGPRSTAPEPAEVDGVEDVENVAKEEAPPAEVEPPVAERAAPLESMIQETGFDLGPDMALAGFETTTWLPESVGDPSAEPPRPDLTADASLEDVPGAGSFEGQGMTDFLEAPVADAAEPLVPMESETILADVDLGLSELDQADDEDLGFVPGDGEPLHLDPPMEGTDLDLLDLDAPDSPAGPVPLVAQIAIPVPGAEDAPFEALDAGDLTEELDRSDPVSLRRHATALLEAGNRQGGIEVLEDLVRLHELAERWEDALQAAGDLVMLEPDAIPRYQKRVELAYLSGEKSLLVRTYLGLADALVRQGGTHVAVAVYERVLEHDPANEPARTALATLAPREVPVLAPQEAPVLAPQEAPAPATAPGSEFVDLGALILDHAPERDTRMRVEAEEPVGDEDQDFLETLAQFKRGIEENLDAGDFQAHYDLGIAFKEMGLLDEAIAQFQKALRSPSDRLKASEALGICFFDRGRLAIAEAVLRRAVDGLPGGDDEKIGLIYWLGRALEAETRIPDALACYERALAVDIQFLDLSERIHRLAGGQA